MSTQPTIPKSQIIAWSRDIGASPIRHKPAILRIMRKQKKLLKWVIANGKTIQLGSDGLPERMLGLIARLFDLCGGRLKSASSHQIEQCQSQVMSSVSSLLPADEGFPERIRSMEWRAQPHILDEVMGALFDPTLDEDKRFDPTEAFKLVLLLWVCVEVLHTNWQPPSSFLGED